ncbi:hypothetical protein COB72_11340 [bacterium]|nr:MAG: hypothetical protein COB72_11340 [bacterium]
MMQDTHATDIVAQDAVAITDGSIFESPENILEGVATLWNTHLFSLNDTAITVSKLAIALLVLLIGVAVAKIISNRVGQKVLPRMQVNQGAANALQSIMYYAMLTMTVLLSLQIAEVPLTALAFFGGAIALGFGFGSQNVINNFISGLIVLIERPISVGDLVTINGQQGCVVSVGARATKLESYMGVTYIVPNSIILENSVTNWNMPTASIKTVIGVGVAYGSDTAKVRTLLEGVMNGHAMVSESSENTIMFVNFGDSSLDFEIHCRISPKSVQEAKTFESDIRFTIDEEFRKNGIQIPFPQRDVHVKSGTL